MEYILSIDVSHEPACAVVAEIDGKTVKVVERVVAPIGPLFSRESLLRIPQDSVEATADGQTAQALITSTQPDASQLRALLSQISSPWITAVLVIPAHDYLSLNLTLPIKDSRAIDKVIDLEVQDLVPFDVGEFFVEHSSLGPTLTQDSEVHVSLLPRRAVREVLRICSSVGVEPSVITTPSGILSSLLQLAPDYFAKNCVLLLGSAEGTFLAFVSNGKVLADRAFEHGDLEQSPHEENELYRAIKVTLASLERQYQVTAEKLYILGTSISSHHIQQALGRQVEIIKSKDIFADSTEDSLVALLGAATSVDPDQNPPFTNFRSREFSYHAYLRELLRAGRKLLPLAIISIVVIICSVLVVYVHRQQEINTLREKIRSEIGRVIPNVDLPEGQELVALNRQIDEIEKQLKGLGSFSRHNPLDALLEISNDLPLTSGITGVTRVKIVENNVRVEVKLANFSARDTIERAFKRRGKGVLCKTSVKDSSGGGGTSNIMVTIEGQLCE